MSPERTDTQPFGTTVASELGGTPAATSSTGEGTKEKVRDLGSSAAEKARSAAEHQKTRATGELHAIASALHQAGRQLSSEGRAAGRLLDVAADRLDQFSNTLDSRNVLDDARTWARRRPAVLIGGATALGFVASRFLKASAEKAPPRTERMTAADVEPLDASHDSSRFGENAIIMAAVGIAVGAALGALIPESGREHALLGEARERVVSQATSTARQKAEDAKKIARDAALAAVQQAKSEVRGESGPGDRSSQGESAPFV